MLQLNAAVASLTLVLVVAVGAQFAFDYGSSVARSRALGVSPRELGELRVVEARAQEDVRVRQRVRAEHLEVADRQEVVVPDPELERLLGSPELRARLADGARASVAELDADRIYGRIEQLLEAARR